MPSKQEILAREARWMRPAGLATTAGVVMFALASYYQLHVGGADIDAAGLIDREAHQGALLAASVVGAIGTLMIIAGLYFLLSADIARSPRVRRHMLIVVVLGPVLLAIASVVTAVFYNQAAHDFVAGGYGPNAEDHAKALIHDRGVRYLASNGLGLAGSLGTGIGALYTALWAGRVGLLSRFWATTGLAAGAVFVLFPFGLLLWLCYLGLLLGWGSRTRSPAWAQGEAVPWPDPRKARLDDDVVAGSGREVEGAANADRPAAEPPAAELEPGSTEEWLGETQGQRRKKRKRRH